MTNEHINHLLDSVLVPNKGFSVIARQDIPANSTVIEEDVKLGCLLDNSYRRARDEREQIMIRTLGEANFSATLMEMLANNQVDEDKLAIYNKLFPRAIQPIYDELLSVLEGSGTVSLIESNLVGNNAENYRRYGKRAFVAVYAKVRFNSFLFESDTGCTLAIYDKISRFNHSCEPNAEYVDYPDSDLLRKGVRTIRDIRAGEELLVSYNAIYSDQNTLARKERLYNTYLFHCGCEKCKAERLEKSGIEILDV